MANVIVPGDPRWPERPTSADDEKLLDQKGRPLSDTGKKWSEASTDLWLYMGVLRLPQGRRPKAPEAGWWNNLELPSDLAGDLKKQRYLWEWIRDELEMALRREGL